MAPSGLEGATLFFSMMLKRQNTVIRVLFDRDGTTSL
jgi:hypothetical protein